MRIIQNSKRRMTLHRNNTIWQVLHSSDYHHCMPSIVLCNTYCCPSPSAIVPAARGADALLSLVPSSLLAISCCLTARTPRLRLLQGFSSRASHFGARLHDPRPYERRMMAQRITLAPPHCPTPAFPFRIFYSVDLSKMSSSPWLIRPITFLSGTFLLLS